MKVPRFRKKSEKDQQPRPKTTDEILQRHRKEIFSRGRRFIRPLHLTKRNIVRNSAIVGFIVTVLFFSSVTLSIYRYKSENRIIYQIAKIVPFPAARVNGEFVPYSQYLFILKSNQNFIENKSDQNLAELDPADNDLRRQALEQAKLDATLTQLAQQKGVVVSRQEIEEQIQLLVSFSGGERRLNDIIKDFYGIEIGELRQLLKIQLLKQKIAPVLSEQSRARTESIRQQLLAGGSFTEVAIQNSEDETTASGGGIINVEDNTTKDTYEDLAKVAANLDLGAISELVEGKEGFHIITKINDENSSPKVAHILIRYDDVDLILADLLSTAKVNDYIKIN